MEINPKLVLPPLFKLRDDVGDLTDLKNSLKEQGQLIPIIVRKENEKYRLIDGHRRWTAILELGWDTIKSDIIEGDDKQALVAAIVANLERKDFDPIETAKAFNLYITEKGYGSAKDLAGKLGKSESYVSKTLTILNLPDEPFEAIKAGRLSPTHGMELARLDTKKATELAEAIKETDLDSKQTRKAVSFIINQGMNVPQAVHTVLNYPEIEVPRHTTKFDSLKMARQQIVLTLQKALKNIDFHLDTLEDGPEKAVWIRDVRYKLHELINSALKVQKEYSKG